MNLFEKIFNYEIISRVEQSGTFIITSHERSWLKTMLSHPSAAKAFTPATWLKLQTLLSDASSMDTTEHLIEKARSVDHELFPSCLQTLRHHITQKDTVHFTYTLKNNQCCTHAGLPCKLEYSMVKREWCLIWFQFRHQAIRRTPLHQLSEMSPGTPLPPAQAKRIFDKITQVLEKRKRTAIIEIVSHYTKELSRILHAFSCFEKEIKWEETNGTYRVHVTYLGDEAGYLLQKLRFLGMRVKVIEGDYLKKRLRETALKSLARYESH